MATKESKGEARGFDLSKNDLSEIAETGFRFELKMPGTEEGVGAFFTVRGAKSPKVLAFAKKKYNEYQLRAKDARRRNKEAEDLTLDEAEDMGVDSAYIRLIKWEGMLEDGVAIPFDEENVKRVLRKHDWIRTQITDASDDIGNFIPK